jgi:hypothetical protein
MNQAGARRPSCSAKNDAAADRGERGEAARTATEALSVKVDLFDAIVTVPIFGHQFFALMWICSFKLGGSACLVARLLLPF